MIRRNIVTLSMVVLGLKVMTSPTSKRTRNRTINAVVFQDVVEKEKLTGRESDRFKDFGKSIYNFFNKDLVREVKDLSRGAMSDFLAVNHLKNLNLKLW